MGLVRTTEPELAVPLEDVKAHLRVDGRGWCASMYLMYMDTKLLDVKAVAALLGVSQNSVWKWHASGKLAPVPVKIGHCTRWRSDQVQAWIAAGCPGRDAWQV